MYVAHAVNFKCAHPSPRHLLGIYQIVRSPGVVQKSVMLVQSCCFATASLRSYYLRYIVMSQKQNILGAN